jgi:Tol biopolymer transport system component
VGIGAATLAAVGAYLLFANRSQPGPALVEIPLTSYTGTQGSPALSPDGSQFAFSWDGDQGGSAPQLYVSLLGRGAPVRLTNYPNKQAISPSWSPDGQSISFTSGGRLLLIPALGGPERDLGPISGNLSASGGGPASWSPDGKWLYLAAPSAAPGTVAIFMEPANGGERRQITDPPHGTNFGDIYPAVSPDASKLAFVRQVGDYSADLFVMDLPPVAGKAPRPLTRRHELMRSPTWTADGKEILFAAGEVATNAGVYRVRASGGEPDRRHRQRRPESEPFAQWNAPGVQPHSTGFQHLSHGNTRSRRARGRRCEIHRFHPRGSIASLFSRREADRVLIQP